MGSCALRSISPGMLCFELKVLAGFTTRNTYGSGSVDHRRDGGPDRWFSKTAGVSRPITPRSISSRGMECPRPCFHTRKDGTQLVRGSRLLAGFFITGAWITWGFHRQMEVSEKMYTWIIHFNRIFHYKPSILDPPCLKSPISWRYRMGIGRVPRSHFLAMECPLQMEVFMGNHL